MIGDPPVVTLRRGFSRPDAAQLAAFAGVPTGFVVDAQNGQGAVDHRIKPLWPEVRSPRPAVTVDCGPRDNLGLFVAIEVAQPGRRHHAGDRRLRGHLGARRPRRGDGQEQGRRRDRHRRPGARRRGPAAGRPAGLLPRRVAQQPVQERALRGRHVGHARRRHDRSGDLVVGDRDGVVVVPQARIDEVAAALQAVHAKEHEMGAAIEAGLPTPGLGRRAAAARRARGCSTERAPVSQRAGPVLRSRHGQSARQAARSP